MKLLLSACIGLLMLPAAVSAQEDDDWPPLNYLRGDYKAVAVVLHIRIERAEITSRIIGYENWTINAVVLESFKGKFKKGDAIVYVHGAEAGFKQEHFTGEKIVFLLAERDQDKKPYYAVLENSTLPYKKETVTKLRSIKKRNSPRSRIHLHHERLSVAFSAGSQLYRVRPGQDGRSAGASTETPTTTARTSRSRRWRGTQIPNPSMHACRA
jgi:hypothetical protein